MGDATAAVTRAVARRAARLAALCIALSLALNAAAHADGTGDIVPLALSVSGKIQVYNDSTQQTYYFDQRALQALPQYEMTTSTPWTPVARFRGPRLEDLLRHVKATGTRLDIEAYDGYIARDIPVADATTFHLLLAYMKDGAYLKLRDMGPLLLLYPRDGEYQSLRTSEYSTREVRQIKAIVVK
jgi:hypothetical protein